MSRSRDKWSSLVLILVALGLSFAISLWALHLTTPRPAPEPAPPTAVGIQGFPRSVAPLSLLERARKLTARPLFRGMVVEGAKSDGRLDLSEPGTSVRYSFQDQQGMGVQPKRKPGTLPRRTYCGRQNIILGSSGIAAERDEPKVGCPNRALREVHADPACGLDAVWRHALQLGVAPEAKANIELFEGRKASIWRFSVGGQTKFHLSANTCRQLGEARDTKGSVP